MKNKVLVRLIVPELDTSFDVFVPINEVIWRLKILFIKSVSDLSSFSLPENVNYILLNKDTGKIYQNNELELAKITSSLEKIKEKDYKKKKEEINDTKYTYEEFENYNSMMLKYAEDITEENSKTRFYFNKENKLEYIKTIWNDKEELLKVDLTYEVEDTLFDIPENFKQG